MDKRIAGLLGAAAALTTVTVAQAAAPAQTTEPTSYQDLLNPVPNAVAALTADEAQMAQQQPAEATNEMQVAQMYYRHHHHHHHHHIIIRPFRRHFRYYHHHHHHHHHFRHHHHY